MTDREAYVAFNLTEQIGSVKTAALAAKYGSVAAAWENFPKAAARDGGEVDWPAEFDKAARYGVEIVTPADALYPRHLLATPGHPLVLYVKGDAKALSAPGVAIVGTRRPTQYGLDAAESIAADLADTGWAVFSGLAIGIDAAAHKGALSRGGKTVGVIGSALDRFYPEENRALAREIVSCGGAVASEFPFGRKPDTQTFPQRNHTVAALSRGVVAVEAPVKSGTLITTSMAADLGRPVMAVPGRIDSRACAGCLSLIREGARLVRNARDIDEELSTLVPRSASGGRRGASAGSSGAASAAARERAADVAPAPSLSVEEAQVMRHLSIEGVPVDMLAAKSGFSAAKVNSICISLRMKGRLRFLPGNRAALPREK